MIAELATYLCISNKGNHLTPMFSVLGIQRHIKGFQMHQLYNVHVGLG